MHMYSFLMDFMSYFQMLTLLNLGMIFIDKNSALVKFQKRLIKDVMQLGEDVMLQAGKITQKCRYDKYCNTEEGRKVLGLASAIRDEKIAFKENTETERNSTFLPAMGLTSGLFCMLYVLMVPYYEKTGNDCFIFFLEYFAEAVCVSHVFVWISLAFQGAYRNFLSSLCISVVWLIIPLLVAVLLHCLDYIISCFDIMVYLFMFVILPMLPILTMVVRIIVMIADRFCRIRSIKNKAEELADLLDKNQ